MRKTLFLLLGVSGTGKSSIIRHLKQVDTRFQHVSVYTTRLLRPEEVGKQEKIHIKYQELLKLRKEDKLLSMNQKFGVWYGINKLAIEEIFETGKIPLLEWPIEKMPYLIRHFSRELFSVYVEPPCNKALHKRLQDGRDIQGIRFQSALSELKMVRNGIYDNVIDYKVCNQEGKLNQVSRQIYHQFMKHTGYLNKQLHTV